MCVCVWWSRAELGSSTCCRRIYRISWQQQRQWQRQRQHELILGCSLILLQFLFENFIGNKAEQPRGRRQWGRELLPAKHIETAIAGRSWSYLCTWWAASTASSSALLPSCSSSACTACCARLVLVIVIVAALYRNLQSICRAVRPGMVSCPMCSAPNGVSMYFKLSNYGTKQLSVCAEECMPLSAYIAFLHISLFQSSFCISNLPPIRHV